MLAQLLVFSTLGQAILSTAVLTSERWPTSIKWSSCPDSYPKLVDCAKFKVPMDYSNPWDHNQVTLSLVRVKALGSNVLGNLLVNPGGPGGSAVNQVLSHVKLIANDTNANGGFSAELGHHYNIIGVDPRGVGQSNATRCDPEAFNKRVSNHFSTDEEYKALLAYNKDVGQSCLNLTGPLLNYVDTVSVARDLDRIRQALGDEKLNWFGFSYGTQIGSQYAAVFPRHVGRMVLDGIVDHGESEVSSMMAESVSFEATLNQFFDWCSSSAKCALHGHNAPALFDELVTEANARPIPAPACKDPKMACREDATGWEILSNVQGYLVSSSGKIPGESWELLAEALNTTMAGNASALSASLATSNDSGLFASFSVGCQDWRHKASSFGILRAKQIAVIALAPHTRGVSQGWDYQSKCVGWPTKTTNGQLPLDQRKIKQAPPMMLINSFWDPETSVAWAAGLKTQIPKAVLVFRNGSGHTSYDHYGDTQKAIDKFLIKGTLPTDDSIYNT